MRKIMYPNYNDSCVNLANSIRKHFGLKTYHETLKVLDNYLDNDYQNVVLFLYDGMGTNVYRKQIRNSFFDKHLVKTISSVGPPTTTSATTSLRTGLYPSEHHWIGWSVYVEEENEIILLYRNKKKKNDEEYPYDVGKRYMPYKTIVEEINEKRKYSAYSLFPFGNDPYETLDDMFKRVKELCKIPGKKYIYVYYENPDSLLHLYGSKNIEVKREIQLLNDKTKKFCEEIDDSLVIITADHGHIDVEMLYLEDYPDIVDTLERDISLDGRTISFKVKRGRKKEFKSLCHKHFKKDFRLFSQSEILKKNYFGLTQDERLLSEIGDFVLVATSNKYLTTSHNDSFKYSSHAGATKEEMEIPLIIVTK